MGGILAGLVTNAVLFFPPPEGQKEQIQPALSFKTFLIRKSTKSTGTMEKRPTKISCSTHFFLHYYWNEFKIFTCGTFISAVLYTYTILGS